MLSKEEIIGSSKTVKEDVVSGIYFLIKNEEIIYIGSAYNVKNRLQQHRANKRMSFTHYKIIPTSINALAPLEKKSERFDLERKYIEEFRPLFNFQWNPEVEKGSREVLRTFLNHFKSAEEVSEILGISTTTIGNVIFRRGNVRNIIRAKIEDEILSRSTSNRYKARYLEYRYRTEGF